MGGTRDVSCMFDLFSSDMSKFDDSRGEWFNVSPNLEVKLD